MPRVLFINPCEFGQNWPKDPSSSVVRYFTMRRFPLIRHLFHRICHQYKPTKILGHKKLWSDKWAEKYHIMGRKVWCYGQKNTILWSENGQNGPSEAAPPLSLSPVNSISPPPIPVQQRLPADQLNSLFSLLKIGNPFFVD